MKEFQMTPAQWHGLSRIDKKVLHYHRIMEGHYLDKMQDRTKHEVEQDTHRREFLNRLPAQQKRRGR